MYSIIFDILTDPLSLPINALWEYLILAVIGMLAFAIGWEVSPGGIFGAIIHWTVRLLAFFALWAITYAVIATVQWIIRYWLLTVGILAIAMFAVVGVSIIRRTYLPKR